MTDRYPHEPSDPHEASSSYSEDGFSSPEARDRYHGADTSSGSDGTVSLRYALPSMQHTSEGASDHGLGLR